MRDLPSWYEDETLRETGQGKRQGEPTRRSLPSFLPYQRGSRIEMSSSAEMEVISCKFLFL